VNITNFDRENDKDQRAQDKELKAFISELTPKSINGGVCKRPTPKTPLSEATRWRRRATWFFCRMPRRFLQPIVRL